MKLELLKPMPFDNAKRRGLFVPKPSIISVQTLDTAVASHSRLTDSDLA
jgi:hypothetical protein